MAATALGTVLHNLCRSVLPADEADRTDSELLEWFVERQDEAAFDALLRRHGPMVLGVCRRVLRNEADAEDAFQATFLVLVRKAATIRPAGRVGNWLHGVALTTALKARAMINRRIAKEREAARRSGPQPVSEAWQQVQALLDRELKALPERYRAAIVLCDLEGRPSKEAARQLGCPLGTLSARLTRGRRLLARRLARYGVGGSGVLMALMLTRNAAPAAIAPALASAVKQAVPRFLAGGAAAKEGISPRVLALTQGVLRAMSLSKLAFATALVLVVTALIGISLCTNPVWADKPVASQQGPDRTISTETEKGVPRIIAQGSYLSDLAWTPDSKQVFLVSMTNDRKEIAWNGRPISRSTINSTARLVDIQKDESKDVVKEQITYGLGLALSPDGKTLAVSVSSVFEVREPEVRLIDVASGKVRHQFTYPGLIQSVHFSPDGKTLLVGGTRQPGVGEVARTLVKIWDLEKQQSGPDILGVPGPEQFRVGQPTILSPDGKLLATAELDGRIRLWHVATGKLHSVLAGHREGANAMAFGRDGTTLISGCTDQVKVWDLATGKALRTLPTAKGWVLSIAVSPDGKLLAISGGKIAGDGEGRIHVYGTETWKLKATLKVPGSALAIAFSPDGTMLAAARGRMKPGKWDGDLRLWKVEKLLQGG